MGSETPPKAPPTSVKPKFFLGRPRGFAGGSTAAAVDVGEGFTEGCKEVQVVRSFCVASRASRWRVSAS